MLFSDVVGVWCVWRWGGVKHYYSDTYPYKQLFYLLPKIAISPMDDNNFLSTIRYCTQRVPMKNSAIFQKIHKESSLTELDFFRCLIDF